VKKKVTCTRCGGAKIIKNGNTRKGKQKYRCKRCHYQFVEHPDKQPVPEWKKAYIRAAFLEKISLRGIRRLFKVGMTWLCSYLRDLGRTVDYQSVLPPIETSDLVVEADELWVFIGSKRKVQWLWIAQDRKTRAVLAFHLGGHREEECLLFWNKIPVLYRQNALFYTDLWKTYLGVIPLHRHRPQEHKGQTNHIERLNGTLRALNSRLVRKSYAFSKSFDHCVAHLNLFFYHHNLKCLQKLSFAS